MTRQHTAHEQGEAFESFRNAVLEFTNAASLEGIVSKSDPMQVGSVNMPGDGTESREFLPAESSSGVDTVNIWAVSRGQVCYNNGGRGHYARSCPRKGNGKGHATMGSKEGGKSWEKGGKDQGKKGGKFGGKAILLEKDILEVAGLVEGVTSPMSARKAKARH